MDAAFDVLDIWRGEVAELTAWLDSPAAKASAARSVRRAVLSRLVELDDLLRSIEPAAPADR